MTHTRLINVVDLTGDGEQNENHQRLDPAVSRAFAEAARLTSHFDSWSSRSKPSSSDNIDPREKILTPTLAARPPRLGIFGKTGRPAIKSFQKPENNIAGSGRDSPAFSTGSVVFPTTPGAFEPVTKPPSNTRGSGVKQNKPLETQSAPHRANTSAVRTPRTAAVFAKQNITETCNEMEEWMNRDPKLVPQQAAITTPRKHGRPKKDPDEWSPKSHVSHSIGTPKGLLSVLDYQTPTTGVDTHGSLPVSEYKSLPPAEIVWGHNFARKRKYSDTLQSRQPSAKQVKSEHIPASSQISNPTTRDRFLNTELGSDTRHRSHGSHNSERLTLDSSFLKPAAFVEEVGKVTSLPLHSPKKAGQDAQQFISETSVDPALTTDSHSAIDDILDTVVYPSIKKLKKRHRDSLAQGELNDIGKDVSFFSDS